MLATMLPRPLDAGRLETARRASRGGSPADGRREAKQRRFGAPSAQRAEWPGEDDMPYDQISDLPKSQVDQYSHHQKEAFLEAFNRAIREYDGDEGRAFAVAHAAAQKAPKKDPHPDD
jgi:cation transport regulator